MLTLSHIYIYPIKSMGGISLKKCTLDRFGLKFDRRWMVVDSNGDFLTQRQRATMCLFNVNLHSNGLLITHKEKSDLSIKVPFEPVSDKCIRVKVWNDECDANIVDEAIDKQLSAIFDQPVHLVKMPDEELRQVDTRYTPHGTTTAFTDGFPLLLIGQASLDLLNSKLEKAVTMQRFRPNIVFVGGEAHSEDRKGKFKIGEVLFEGVKLCARCVVTTIHPNTGKKDSEPLKTLAKYRTMENKVVFGMNVYHHSYGDVINVGDTVSYL